MLHVVCIYTTSTATALAVAHLHLDLLCKYVSCCWQLTCLLTKVMLFILITIHLLLLVFIMFSSSCVPSGTSVPLSIVGCASTSVHKLLLRFQNFVHRGFGANYNVSVQHSMLLTLATKRHVDLKRRILMRSKLHRRRWSNCNSAAPGVELARGDLISCNLPARLARPWHNQKR